MSVCDAKSIYSLSLIRGMIKSADKCLFLSCAQLLCFYKH